MPLVASEDGERRLGDVGTGHLRRRQPVRDRLPRIVGDRIDRGADALVLPGRDGELDAELRRGGDHRLGVKGAVGPHGELPSRAGTSDPADGLGQKRGRAARRACCAAAEPAHQYLPGLGAGRELRVVAAYSRVAERRALLGPPMHRHDGRVDVDGQRRSEISRAGARGPQPGQQLTADRVKLTDVGPLVRPQPRSDRRGRPRPVEQGVGSAGPQHRDVVDAVSAGEYRTDHRQRLRAAVRAVLNQMQAPVDQPGQVQPLSQDRRREQPRVRHQIRLVEAHRNPAQLVICSHSASALPSDDH